MADVDRLLKALEQGKRAPKPKPPRTRGLPPPRSKFQRNARRRRWKANPAAIPILASRWDVAQARVAAAEEARTAVIRKALDAGMQWEEIHAATGLSISTIARIARRTKATKTSDR